MIMSRIHTYEDNQMNVLLIEIAKQLNIQLSKYARSLKDWYRMNVTIQNNEASIMIDYEKNEAKFKISIINACVYCDDEYIDDIYEPNFLSNVDKIIKSRKLYECFAIYSTKTQ